jgi:hypothetical protein
MSKTFLRNNIALFCLAAVAVLLVIARACLQSVTIDEANSCLGFARNPLPLQWYPSSDNHVLNSLLERLVISIFGLNELTMRSPAIAGAFVYAGAALYFSALVATKTIVKVSLFLCLVYNPMVLDYLVAARGYSLAIGFLLAAITVMAGAILEDKGGQGTNFHRKCVWASVLLALSFAANFSFAFVDAATMLVFFFWAAAQARRSRIGGYSRLAASCFLPGVVVAFVLVGWTVLHFPRKSDLTPGSQSLLEMWQGLVAASFDDLNPEMLNPWLILWLSKTRHVLPYLGVLVLILLLAGIEIKRWRSRNSGSHELVTLLRLLVGISAITLLMHWIAFSRFHILLPTGRTGLFFVVLWTLIFGVALSIRAQSAGKDVIRTLGATTLILAGAYFVGCLRMGYFKEWKFNADTKQLYWLVNDLHVRCGITKFATDWRYGAALRFYRQAYGSDSLAEFSDLLELPTDRSAYVLFYPSSEAFIRRQQLQVIYHNGDTGEAVAIRGCKAD